MAPSTMSPANIDRVKLCIQAGNQNLCVEAGDLPGAADDSNEGGVYRD